MPDSQPKYVIIGAGGFIGEGLCSGLLKSGIPFVVADKGHRLARITHLVQGAQAIPYDGDDVSRLYNVLQSADVLVHLSWTSQPAQSMKSMVDDAEQNILNSLKLFQFAGELGVKKIIFASSGGTVYGNVTQTPIPETTPLNPVSAYGVSKVAVEQYLQLVAFHYGLTGISLRIGNPYGNYQFAGLAIGVIANFILRAMQKAPLQLYGDGNILRDYIWIDDLVRALITSASADIPSGAYNIGSGTGYTINEIADRIEQNFPGLPQREYRPLRSFDAQQIVLDISKFSSLTGWSPRISLDDGISTMLAEARRKRGRKDDPAR